MSTDNKSLPLWQVMLDAYTQNVNPSGWRYGYAAEIRALADIIEKRGERRQDLDPGETADWLRAEAERAELESPKDCR